MREEIQTLTRVEKHVISSSDPWFPMFSNFCFLSKNLYNHANFLVRQSFISERKWLSQGINL